MLHGRLLAGLAARTIERDHGDDKFMPVRLTVDLYRAPTMELTTVESTLVRAGGRVRVVDAEIVVGGQAVARASSIWLLRGETPEGEDVIPGSSNWDAELPTEDAPQFASVDAAFDIRPVGERGFGAPGPEPRRVWLRDRRPIVAGESFTPFVRVALCADFASPLANSSPTGLDYINADLTLHIARRPAGEWIGVETAERVAADGVSVAQCRYVDERGPLGFSSVSAVLTPRMPRPSSDT
jgi:hypothetical protein